MDVLHTIEALVLVFGLLLGMLVAGRRLGWIELRQTRFASRPRRMEVLERVPLNTNHTLHLVRWDDRCLLLASSPGSCQVIDAGLRSGDPALERARSQGGHS
jgi:flagellar biogenesis protein FliO